MTTPDQLTAEERAHIMRVLAIPAALDMRTSAKLLRIVDQQRARIAELQQYIATQDAFARVRTSELEAENASLRDMLRAALEQPAQQQAEVDRAVAIALESGNRRAELEAEFGRILDYECGVCGRVYRGHERGPCCSRCGSHSKQAEVKLPQG